MSTFSVQLTSRWCDEANTYNYYNYFIWPNWCWFPGAGRPQITKYSATCLVSSPIFAIFVNKTQFFVEINLNMCYWRDHDHIWQSEALTKSHAFAWWTQLTPLVSLFTITSQSWAIMSLFLDLDEGVLCQGLVLVSLLSVMS